MSLTTYAEKHIIAAMTARPGGFEWDDRESIPASEGPAPPRIIRAVPVQPPASDTPPVSRTRPRLSLRAMREEAHKTQAEVAAALGTEQGEISRVERREDVRLSTLRRYAEAIGAECEVVFVFAKTGRAITLADPV